MQCQPPIGDGGDRRNRFPGPGIAAIGKLDGSILYGNFVDDEGSIVSALVKSQTFDLKGGLSGVDIVAETYRVVGIFGQCLPIVCDSG